MQPIEKKRNRNGYTLVYTGEGKGKTTAAVGLAVRAAGRGFKVLILQFIKSPKRTYGEQISLGKIGIEMRQLGVGFTWTRTPEEHRSALREAWAIAKHETMHGDWDVVIFDEINNALSIERFPVTDILPLTEVLELIEHRPTHIHLVLTGRNAQPEIIEKADLVSEVQVVKHYYHEGVAAVLGIEY